MNVKTSTGSPTLIAVLAKKTPLYQQIAFHAQPCDTQPKATPFLAVRWSSGIVTPTGVEVGLRTYCGASGPRRQILPKLTEALLL